MAAHEELALFLRALRRLAEVEQDAFTGAMKQMVADLRAGRRLRPSPRVKGLQRHPGVFEMTWAPDGRATFEYGAEQQPGEPHIIWRRIGGHEILRDP